MHSQHECGGRKTYYDIQLAKTMDGLRKGVRCTSHNSDSKVAFFFSFFQTLISAETFTQFLCN